MACGETGRSTSSVGTRGRRDQGGGEHLLNDRSDGSGVVVYSRTLQRLEQKVQTLRPLICLLSAFITNVPFEDEEDEIEIEIGFYCGRAIRHDEDQDQDEYCADKGA